ncbi:unnamed protein product [Cylicostephanus goldi]|uniref:Uncharacterized protein n=1 Tax=Cylicostephanus goldi TaxID=71465 RepID=A0A3P7Q6V7_CYLGO|nr:unnamed protein product [Cylicostephanus goldi]
MILKLFIIPWVWAQGQNVPSNPAVPAVASAPNGQIDIPFYQFLQRQNQINNAILLNNAMLANSLTAMPSSEHHHQIPIPSAIQFPSAGHTLHPSHAALFPNFQPKFPTVPTTGLNQLGLYDVLSHPVKLDGVPSVIIPTHVVLVSPSTTASPPVGTTTAREDPDKTEVQEPEPIPIGVSEPDERMKKVLNLSATPRPKLTDTTDSPALTELIEEIGEENLVTTTTEQVVQLPAISAQETIDLSISAD